MRDTWLFVGGVYLVCEHCDEVNYVFITTYKIN